MKIYSLAFLWYIPIISGLLFQFPFASPVIDSQQKQNTNKPGVANIVFKSADGGQTWQDISKGLPENSAEGGFFANESGLYLRAGKGTYHSNPNSTTLFWQKEIFPDKWSSITAGKSGMFAYNYWGQIVQKISGTSVWSPVYTNFQSNIRTVFETARGAVFVGSDNGLYKSTDNGKTWKHVHAGGWVIKMVEQHGVMVATSMSGIIQSTDEGENWSVVISEGGVGIDVAPIKGGFAAINYNTASKTRSVEACRGLYSRTGSRYCKSAHRAPLGGPPSAFSIAIICVRTSRNSSGVAPTMLAATTAADVCPSAQAETLWP